MYGLPTPAPEPDEPQPDYAREVERQLAIADAAKWADKMWSEILSHYRPYAATLKYVPRPRR